MARKKRAIDALIRCEVRVSSPVLITLENRSAELRSQLATLRRQLGEPGHVEAAVAKIKLAESEHTKLAEEISRIKQIIETVEKLLHENATEVAEHALRRRLGELMTRPAV